jgi:mutator protein MutT
VEAPLSTRQVDVAVALVRRDGLWLVARRPPDAHLPDVWEFPGGKCQAGESAEQTALRELREECGVIAVADEILGAWTHDYGDRVVRLTAVLCRWNSGEAQPLGCTACRWVSLAELASLEMPAVNAEIIAALRRVGST